MTVTDEEYAALGKEAIETALYKIFQDEDSLYCGQHEIGRASCRERV